MEVCTGPLPNTTDPDEFAHPNGRLMHLGSFKAPLPKASGCPSKRINPII